MTVSKSWTDYFGELAKTKPPEPGDEKFSQEPVPAEIFFRDWMGQPLFPEQLKPINAMFSPDFKDMSSEVNELLLMYGEGCMVGSTIVKTYKGANMTLEQLYNKPQVRVICVDKDGNKTVGMLSQVRIAKMAYELCHITLNTKEVISCTPEHRILTAKNEWKEAYKLAEGDVLMDTSYPMSEGWKLKVKAIRTEKLAKAVPVYDFSVASHLNVSLGSGAVVHNSGKDFLCERMLIYVAYWLLCLRSPQAYLGRADGTPIDLVNTSVNEEHASNVFFKQFCDALRIVTNPKSGKNWFEEQGMDLREGKDILISQVRFPKFIMAYSCNSVKWTAEGKNVLIGILDEIAEFKYDKAKALYTNLKATCTSRFPKQHKVVLISYLRDEFDFMNSHYSEVDTMPFDLQKKYFRSKKCTWEVNLHRKKEDFSDAYHNDPEDSARRYENKIPSKIGAKFLKEPRHILSAVRPGGVSPLISDHSEWTDGLMSETLAAWFKPFMVKEIYDLELEYMKTRSEDIEKAIIAERERHMNSEYFIHIDLSGGAVDCAGLVMMHNYQYTTSQTGYYVDLAVQIRSNGVEINFEEIQNFVFKLQKMGFPITKITMDNWQSLGTKQAFEKAGIACEVLSVDKSMAPYSTFKDLLYQGLICYALNPILMRELNELVLTNGKVDHPRDSAERQKTEGKKSGSKDVADALAGSLFTAVNINQGDGSVSTAPTEDPEGMVDDMIDKLMGGK